MTDTTKKIPTSEIAHLRLKCYHMAMFTRAGERHFELVDPTQQSAVALMAWQSDFRDEDGKSPLRHLVIEDRRGEHRFVCQRRGQHAAHLGSSIVFETRDDYDSLLPNPGVAEESELFEKYGVII